MPSIKLQRTAEEVKRNGGNISKAMRTVGYSKASAGNVSVTRSKEWPALLEKVLGDDILVKEHKNLLKSATLDHMVFPLGPRDNEERKTRIAEDILRADKLGTTYIEKDYMTDGDIKDLLESVNCTLRRIVHGETSRHAYFWAPDNRAKKDALEMAYKLKNRFAPDKIIMPILPDLGTESAVFNVLNVFVQKNLPKPVYAEPTDDNDDQDDQ